MPRGQKPPHRSQEREFRAYIQRYPASLRETYSWLRQSIQSAGGKKIEWYYLSYGETRYRTKGQEKRFRGRIFAWINIRNGRLAIGIPEHNLQFKTRNATLLRTLKAQYCLTCWYGIGQFKIEIDPGSPIKQRKKELSAISELIRRA